MAYASTSFRSESLPLASRLTALRAHVAERLAQRRSYRATLNELSSLSDHELDDLGIGRGMIPAIAAEAAAKL